MINQSPDMDQLELSMELESIPGQKITNVASIPQRSPFRYPGGKTWLIPYIRQWLSSLFAKPTSFIEPFTGGGIVGLTVAFEELAEHSTMVELDQLVAATWHTILNGNAELLARQIEHFDLTVENVDAVLTAAYYTTNQQAFQTILKNRVNRGGILAPGAGRIKAGEAGKGLKSRWYPETLARRIRNIVEVRSRITFIEGDGIKVMREMAQHDNAVFFIDPPYTASAKKAGSRLYTHSKVNHVELFQIAATLQGDFLMTYDNDSEVRRLAEAHGFDTRTVAMKNTHHAKMSELLIGRNLNWLHPHEKHT